MRFRFLPVWVAAGILLAGGASASAQEEPSFNAWPIAVRSDPAPDGSRTVTGLGPLFFSHQAADGSTTRGLRPLYEATHDATAHESGGSLLYPLLRWDETEFTQSWSLLNLINGSRFAAPGAPEEETRFDAWPFWFSRDTGDPATSYRALFPFYGDVTARFSQDRLQWVLFPLYGHFEKGPVTTDTYLWPFFKSVSGENYRGFEFWPLGGHREETGVRDETFALWPLVYRSRDNLDTAQPTLKAGVLPFYAVDRMPGYESETWLWPFFGYVDRTEPYRYHARNYFWPLFVQGRGDNRYINRWAPFYTHSEIRGMKKTWVMFPFWREASWDEAGIRQQREQLLYFLYHRTTQHSLANPDAAPASKFHLWPLASTWDNGAGRKQLQLLSPFDVFFPHNEHVKRLWSPLFALYRYDQQLPGHARHSLLWNAVTYEENAAEGSQAFQLGPLLGYAHDAEGRQWNFMGGLIRLEREPGRRAWRLRWGQEAPRAAESDSPASL